MDRKDFGRELFNIMYGIEQAKDLLSDSKFKITLSSLNDLQHSFDEFCKIYQKEKKYIDKE